jgi:very-short-patch-repair endonuclease
LTLSRYGLGLRIAPVDHAVALDRDMRGQCRLRTVDADIAALATRQYGVVSRAQLIEIGLSTDAIDRRVARGWLRPIYRGVYAVGHERIPREARWLAAVLAAASGAALSHRAAASLWGIRPYSGRPQVTVPPGARVRPGVIARRSSLQPDEITEERGIPVTTVARTLIDLASVLTDDQLEKAIREAEFLRLFDLTELTRLLDRHPRRKGTAALRNAISQASDARNRTRSDLEDRFISLVSKANLPTPELNGTLELDAMTIEPDAIWRDRKLIVELDSWGAHGTQSAFESDRERDLALAAAGWVSVRITWLALAHGIPPNLQRLLA